MASESFITGPVQSVDIVFSRAVFGKVLIQRARNAPPDSIKDRAILHFTIEVPDADWGYNDVVLTIDRDRVEEKNVEPSELEIVRIPDKAPIERLETNVDTSGPDSIVISTAIQNFSVFALVVTPDQATETAASTSTPSPSPTSLVTASPTNTQVEPSQKTREMSSTLGTDDEMSADSPTPTETSGPGLGIIAASLSLLAGLAWARSRQLWSN